MKHKYVFVSAMLAVILAAGTAFTAACTHLQKETDEAHTFTVVTSFYPMYVAAQNVIGHSHEVKLENLSEPQTGCLHDYQLTAEDMKLLSGADAFVINGGGIEAFLGDVAEQYPKLSVIEASEGMERAQENAHVWMSLEDYCQQVWNIAEGLQALDPAHAESYKANAGRYVEKVQALKDTYRDVFTACEGEPVILFHEAYEYVAEDLGMPVVGVMDLDEERQIGAGEVAGIIDTIRQEQVNYIFAEELYGKGMGDTVSQETGVEVLYLDPCTRGAYEPDSYLEAMEHNLQILQSALAQ